MAYDESIIKINVISVLVNVPCRTTCHFSVYIYPIFPEKNIVHDKSMQDTKKQNGIPTIIKRIL